MKRVYIIFYRWNNTANNHAGMAYFCKMLSIANKNRISLIEIPHFYRRLRSRFQRYFSSALAIYLNMRTKPGDVVFFAEYLSQPKLSGRQSEIVGKLRSLHTKAQLYALIHLPFEAITNIYPSEVIHASLQNLDQIIVMGSSLANTLSDMGYSNKTISTFHYVDTGFYSCDIYNKKCNQPMRVICMGSLFRDQDQLVEIIRACPNIHFEVCLGMNPQSDNFIDIPNVSINRYLPEIELREKMRMADVSLSVFTDTIGSNVIVTSLATGLPQIVADVGSIRDYCTPMDAVFCRNNAEFIAALNLLNDNPKLRLRMAMEATRRAQDFSIQRSIEWYRECFDL